MSESEEEFRSIMRALDQKNAGYRIATAALASGVVNIVQTAADTDLLVAIRVGPQEEHEAGNFLYARDNVLADIIVRGIRSLEAEQQVLGARADVRDRVTVRLVGDYEHDLDNLGS